MQPFIHQLKVYYEDTDAQGVVYYANYLKYLERARTEWLSSMGLSLATLSDELDLIFVVKRAEIEYKAPARLENQLAVSCEIESIKNTSMVLKQNVMCDEQILVQAQVVLVTVDKNSFRPTRLPQGIFDRSFIDKTE